MSARTPMRSDQPIAEALRVALLGRAGRLARRLRQAAKGDVDAVHDSRTMLRRLREIVFVMGRTVFDSGAMDAMGRRLRRVEQLLGPTRDADVFLGGLRAWMARCRPSLRDGIRPLYEQVAKRRRKAAADLADDLRRKPARHIARDLRRLMRLPPAIRGHAGAPAEPTLVRHVVGDETLRGYEEVLAYGSQRRSSDPRVLHELRSACRRLRYRLELFEDALPKEAAFVIATLRALQQRLGRMHDRAVAVETTERLVRKRKVERSAAVDAYLRSHRDTRDRLRAELGSAWRGLTGPAFRDAIASVALESSRGISARSKAAKQAARTRKSRQSGTARRRAGGHVDVHEDALSSAISSSHFRRRLSTCSGTGSGRGDHAHRARRTAHGPGYVSFARSTT